MTDPTVASFFSVFLSLPYFPIFFPNLSYRPLSIEIPLRNTLVLTQMHKSQLFLGVKWPRTS